MVADGGDAAHCSNGLTAQKFREATTEERATYRRWLRGTVAFYALLFLMYGGKLFQFKRHAALESFATSLDGPAKKRLGEIGS